jgi:hypothetical protein
MTRLDPPALASFLRRYRFAGSRLRGLRVRSTTDGLPTIELRLAARTALRDLGTEPRPVRLRLRLVGVEEYRFQKRPGTPSGKVPDARIGYFDGLFFLTLDTWSLEPGEQPKPLDYRASDAYAAGRELWWEEIQTRDTRHETREKTEE